MMHTAGNLHFLSVISTCETCKSDFGEPAHANGGRSLWWAARKPGTGQLIAASVQWARETMREIDTLYERP